jgi:hypothetical protein
VASWGGGWWRRGGGFGGWRWRNVFRATGVPGWRRWHRTAEQLPADDRGIEDERQELEYQAELLETELRRIRTRLDQLHQDQTSET